MPVTPVDVPACSESFTPRSSIMGGILSTTHQNGLTNANKQRHADADYRQQQFDELCLQNRTLPDKDLKKIVMKSLGISRSQYYLAKQRSMAKQKIAS